jgi:hypothetical protein
MDVAKAVSEFVKSGRSLFDQLRTEGQHLSHLDLHLLLTQLFILQMEARSLKSALQNKQKSHDASVKEENDHQDHTLPSLTAMTAQLQVGDRLRAIRDHYPVPLGAIGHIRAFKGIPGNWYAVVDWEKPSHNFSRERRTKLWPISLKNFEVVREEG